MLATQVILCVTIIGNVALLTVVLRERQSLLRTAFAFYLASLTLWAFAIYLNLFLRSMFVEECIFATAAATLMSQFWFAKLFPEGLPPKRLYEYWSLGIGCFFFAASFYPGALFNSIAVHQEGYTILDNGFLSAGYSLFALVYVCAPIFILFVKYRSSQTGTGRAQLRYLTIGFTVFASVAVLTNSVLPVFFKIYTFNAVGPAFSLLFATFVFYIIWKHQFLDIRRAVQRGAIYSLLIATIVAAYIAILFLFDRDFRPSDDLIQPLSAMLVTLIGVFTIPVLERYFQRITDRVFFKDRYDYAQALESLSAILHESTDFEELIELTRQELSDIFRAECVQLVLHRDSIAVSTLSPDERRSDHQYLFEPILVDNNDEIGYIVIGEKRSGDVYGAQDRQLLHTFALQAATAFARVKLYRQVQQHAFELEEKVEDRTQELRHSQERERHTMQDIAHGLQTPLTVFRTRLETMKHATERSSEIDVLERSLADLSDFIQNLLRLAHLEHSPERTASIRCDLSTLVRDACDEITIVTGQQDIVVRHEIEPDIHVFGNRKELRAAIMNIAGNSIKYMRPTGRREIVFSLSRSGDKAVLTIRDTGRGIAPEHLLRVFDRFYRENATDTAGGGLGLAITKTILERHHGTITVASTFNEGTTVTMQLPCLTELPNLT